MTLEYHDIKPDMEFKEVGRERGARHVKVVRGMTYACECLILDGRGAGKNLRVFRKQLVNPKMWERVK